MERISRLQLLHVCRFGADTEDTSKRMCSSYYFIQPVMSAALNKGAGVPRLQAVSHKACCGWEGLTRSLTKLPCMMWEEPSLSLKAGLVRTWKGESGAKSLDRTASLA